jgi:hypothetical protein
MKKRSSIDLLSSHIVLRGLSEPVDICSIANFGVYPDRVLPQFVHEIDHHSCFETPVISALSLLRLEAASLHYQDPSNLHGHICLARHVVASEILRPIIEGFALFSEFDVMVAQTYGNSVSNQLVTLASFFRHRESIVAIEPGVVGGAGMAMLIAPLMRLRTLPELLDRKSNILSSDLTAAGDAYLLGYLAIKNLWVLAAIKFGRLIDSDLFRLLLRHHVFSDSELISLLLDPSDNGNLDGIAFRIRSRLSSFLDLDFSNCVHQLDLKSGSRNIDNYGDLLEQHRIPWESVEFTQLASVSFQETYKRIGKDASNFGKMLHDLSISLFRHRLAATLIEVDTNYRYHNGKLVATYQGFPVFLGEIADPHLPLEGKARLSVKAIPSLASQYSLLFIEEGRKCYIQNITQVGNPTQDDSALKAQLILMDQTILQATEAVELINSQSSSISPVNWPALMQLVREDRERIYFPLALYFARDKAKTREAMSNGGFWQLVGSNSDRLEQLARLSCWSSLCLAPDFLTAMCSKCGFSRDEASRYMLQACEDTGFNFFTLGADGRPISIA